MTWCDWRAAAVGGIFVFLALLSPYVQRQLAFGPSKARNNSSESEKSSDRENLTVWRYCNSVFRGLFFRVQDELESAKGTHLHSAIKELGKFSWQGSDKPSRGTMVQAWDRVMRWDDDCYDFMVLER